MKEILITSSVLIVALLLLRLLFAKKVRRRLIYAAWVLVALRLLIPVQIGQLNFSVLTAAQPLTETVTEVSELRVIGQNEREASIQVTKDYIERDQTVFTPEVQEYIQAAQKENRPAQDIATAIVKTQGDEVFVEQIRPQVQQQVAEQTDFVSVGQIATIIWLAGVALMAVWFTIVNLRYNRMLKMNRERLACKSPIPVYVSDKVDSPCLVGLVHPVVYVTSQCAENPEMLRYVLTHELTHYRHCDHIWSLVRCICLCLYWFDPLVWVAAYISRRDCELACDECALQQLGEAERIAYGRTLLEVVGHAAKHANLLQTATSMNETKKQLKERVNFIVKKPKNSVIAVICMVLICTIVAGCVAAGPSSGQQNLGTDPLASTPSSTPATTQPTQTQPATVPTQPTTVPTQPTNVPTQPTTVPTEPTEPEPTHPAECEYVEVEVLQEATCVQPEIVLYQCVHCGNQIQQQNEKNISHDYSKTAVTKKATCCAEGERSYVCVMCGKTKFYETIPVSSEHDYKVVEREAINGSFAGYKRYNCKDCGVEKEVFYGKYGDYDLDAIFEDMEQYATQLGFCFKIATRDDLSYNANPTKHSFSHCEIMGGPEYLYNEVFKAVQSWCNKVLESCKENGVDPSLYVCELYLTAWDNGSMGGTFFSVYVSTGYSNM